MFIVVFLGWYLGKRHIKEEITSDGLYKAKLTNLFVFIIKFLAPIAIAMVFLHGIGLLKF